MLGSSDGRTRSLVSDIDGQGWDFNFSRHPYHEIERPYGPHYTIYNRRHMACKLDSQTVEEGYWLLRRKCGVLHTGELPVEVRGPDAERLLDLLFTKDITKLRPERCGYGLSCYDDGGMITDGVLLRLEADRFWYAQADGDWISWAKAHARGMDVAIGDPEVYVSQVQGPTSLEVLADAAGGLPEKFTYFGVARVDLGGQPVVVTRTGYTNELGWEFYTEPHHDAAALWAHLESAGQRHGMGLIGLDSMNIRRIEAGIENAGSDFGWWTTPHEVGLGRFIDDKADFVGRAALLRPKPQRLIGLKVKDGEPLLRGPVAVGGKQAGGVTAAAVSPYLGCGVGYALMDEGGFAEGDRVEVMCRDGAMRPGVLAETPFYDKACEIPRGKLVDIP